MKKELIIQTLNHCRQQTLGLFNYINNATFCHQIHPDFSPIGWHLGHIAFTEELWILRHLAKKTPIFKQYHKLFAADGLPKNERGNLPSLSEIRFYLDTVRTDVLSYLKTNPLQEEKLWMFMIQHECQHNETIRLLLQLQQVKNDNYVLIKNDNNEEKTPKTIKIEGGIFLMGNNEIEALDNEKSQHEVYVETYEIDMYPVTCGEYSKFMEEGGYENNKYWSKAGWEWLQKSPVKQPLYWQNNHQYSLHPVCGVNYYEAEAYANFIGRRLPTESEWEKAASWDVINQKKNNYPWGNKLPDEELCNFNQIKFWEFPTTPVNTYNQGKSAYGCVDMLGNVWEWTSTYFGEYPGFKYYPYQGYSQVYFDEKHRILKGGSFASFSHTLRCSFRNWYHPWVREILAGFRTVNRP